MASVDVTYEELVDVREILVKEIRKSLTDDERAFLVSFKEKKPRWDLLDVDGVQDMPAVKWKLFNLSKMDDNKHRLAADRFKKIIEKGE